MSFEIILSVGGLFCAFGIVLPILKPLHNQTNIIQDISTYRNFYNLYNRLQKDDSDFWGKIPANVAEEDCRIGS